MRLFRGPADIREKHLLSVENEDTKQLAKQETISPLVG